MIRAGRMLIAALGFICINGATGYAADVCLAFSGGGGTIVGKGFKVPSVNKCKPFNGFENGGLGGMVTGTACTTANGGSLILQYSYNNYFASGFGNNNYWESGTCNLPFQTYPNLPLSGICRGTVGTTAIGGFTASVNLTGCNVNVPPR